MTAGLRTYPHIGPVLPQSARQRRQLLFVWISIGPGSVVKDSSLRSTPFRLLWASWNKKKTTTYTLNPSATANITQITHITNLHFYDLDLHGRYIFYLHDLQPMLPGGRRALSMDLDPVSWIGCAPHRCCTRRISTAGEDLTRLRWSRCCLSTCETYSISKYLYISKWFCPRKPTEGMQLQKKKGFKSNWEVNPLALLHCTHISHSHSK